MRVLKSVTKTAVEWLLLAVSLGIPVKRGLVVFSMQRGRYCDNSRALFQYIAANGVREMRVVWLSDSALPPEHVPDALKAHFFRRYSVRGFLLCARSELAVISHGFGDFGLFIRVAQHKKVLMLWHAVTTKYCGLLDAKFSLQRKKRYIRKETRFYDAVVTSSDVDRYYTASYTGVKISAVRVTGLPRNDVLISSTRPSQRKNALTKFLYVPTFRDYDTGGSSLFFPFRVEDADIAQWASAKGLSFLLRPHPNDGDSLRHIRNLSEAWPNVFVDCSVSNVPDIGKLITECDGVITDYSSTYLDALLIDRPSVFVDFDHEEYVRTRGLAYDYDLITPGPKVKSWEEFKRGCEDMMHGAPSYGAQREFVRKMFFTYRDAGACARVVEVMREMLRD